MPVLDQLGDGRESLVEGEGEDNTRIGRARNLLEGVFSVKQSDPSKGCLNRMRSIPPRDQLCLQKHQVLVKVLNSKF